MAEMSFGARRHTAVRKAEEDSTPTFNIQALLQGCVATRPDDSSDQTPLIVDFPDRPAKMLAAVLSDYGPAKRLKVQMCDLPRLPLGKLKSTEVVVEVHAASVNPTDCKQRNGQLSQIWPLTLPCVLGVDLAGRVVRAGEDAPFSEGDEVFGRQQLGRMVDINGSYAEYCIVEGADIYRKPSRLTMEEAAAVPYSCLAAYAALAHVGKLAEKRKQADKAVFVLGGSGGVGTFAVQLAKQHFDCFVVASSSEGNIGLLNELGVDEALDYEDPSFLKAVGYTKFDVILDTVGGDDYWSAFKDSLKPDGVYVTTVGKERRGHDGRTIDMSAALSYRADYFLRQAFNSIGADKKYHILTGSQILSSDLRIVASIFEKGIIHPVIAKVYSLYDIAKAHEMSETHHAVGKIVLQVKNGGRETPDGGAPRHDKTAGLQSQMQGVLANKGVLANRDLGPPGNRHGGSKLPTSKVQFNPQVQEPHDDDSEDEYPSLADAPGGRGGVTGGAPGSRTTDILGERVGAQPAQPFQPSDMTQRMTFGAPGSTSTLTKPHSANRPSSALGGGSGLEDRLEQLQREVMESTARVQALKEKNSTMLGGVGTSAVASDHVVGNGRAVGGKGESAGTKTEREAPPSLLPAELSHVASGKVVGTEDRDGGEGSDSSPPRGRSGGLSREDLRMGKGLSAGSSVMARGLEEIDFDAQTSANLGLDSAALEAGLAALQQERLFPRDGADPSHGHGPKSSLEPWDDSAPGYRQGATKEIAPPSTDASDPAVAAKRAAALAKLREMTLGKGMGALGASDADSEGAGGGGLSAAALREARMNAERMKAQASALPRPEDEEEEQPRSDAAAFAGVRRGIEEEEEGGSGGEREARRMGVGGRDDAAAMFQQFKMGMGASSVASAVGSQDSSAPKPYAVRMVSAPVHAHALLDEVIPEDETPPPPRPQVGTAGISGGGGQRPAGAKPRVRINDQAAEREIPGKDEDDEPRGGGGGGDLEAPAGEVLYEGLLRRKKEDHGRFEDPYKMVCVCRLQGSVLRVRLTHNGEVVGLEEQFDLKRDWRLMPRSDKPDRFSLNRIHAGGDGASVATFKAESKDEGNSWVEALMTAQGSSMGFESGRGVDAGMGGKSSAQAKKAAIAARMEADGDNPTVPKAGVGMVLKEMQLPGGDTVLAVKSLAPGAPAVSSGMINPGDILLTVDGKRVTSSAEATKSILGERGSSISLQMERDGERFVVAMRRGTAAKLS